MQVGRHRSSALGNLVGYSFIIQGEWGSEKTTSFFEQ